MSLIDITAGQYQFKNLSKINILLGKNGCGKSTALRELSQAGRLPDIALTQRYLSPERGGAVKYEASYEQNMANNEGWFSGQRLKNQSNTFRQLSVTLFRQLEINILRLIEREKRADTNFTFDTYIDDLNSLLDQVQIIRGGVNAFSIKSRANNEPVNPENISSGESELISLGIECLSFESECKPTGEDILIIDEPDVHLHPDLQSRFMLFLHKLVSRTNFRVVISTHSTPILGALADKQSVSLFFMKPGDKVINFSNINQTMKTLLPVFGAHPLSSVFGQNPVFIVEGTDEERIWQQVVRTANGRVKIYPVETGGVGNMPTFEQESDKILTSVYDTAKGYSLRDGDGETTQPDDLPKIIRFRLNCRSSENLLLSNEVLEIAGSNWESLEAELKNWVTTHATHPYCQSIKDFLASGPDRRNFNLKQIRNIILGSLPTNKPWEVLVGQAIAGIRRTPGVDYQTGSGIHSFLGEKLCTAIIPEA